MTVAALTESPMFIPLAIGLGVMGVFVLLAIIIVVSVMKKVSPALKQAQNLMAGQVQAQARAGALRDGGLKTEALVLNVAPTNMQVNRLPVVRITLQVTPPLAGDPYEVTIESPVPHIHIPRVQPNATVPVVISPDDPKEVVLAL